MCGADDGDRLALQGGEGSPPRVRSRPSAVPVVRSGSRITSACAEQTTLPVWLANSVKDHLRVCGADERAFIENTLKPGSPPRVRSRPRFQAVHQAERGITSACAEQTHRCGRRSRRWRDHLRVCGADRKQRRNTKRSPGSPPRVRSRLVVVHDLGPERRITSACAEQTNPMRQAIRILLGSPPRVRSRRCRAIRLGTPRGITSACAEQTDGGI